MWSMLRVSRRQAIDKYKDGLSAAKPIMCATSNYDRPRMCSVGDGLKMERRTASRDKVMGFAALNPSYALARQSSLNTVVSST